MFEKYRTTSAMWALGRFTVAEVSRVSGVKATTARDVIGSWKSKGSVEEVGTKAGTGPGRRSIEYQVSGDGADLEAWLRLVDLSDRAVPLP